MLKILLISVFILTMGSCISKVNINVEIPAKSPQNK